MKRRILILTLFTVFVVAAHSQIKTDKLKSTVKSAASVANTTAAAAGIDVKSISASIMTKLASSLNLTDAQKPKVLETVTSFLQSKSGIMGLAATDKAQYSSKLSGLTSDLTKKMKGTLTTAQMTKFLSLKSSKLSSTDELSQLFN